MEWVAFYKLARLGLLACLLLGIAIHLYGSRSRDFEAPARRMLEEEDVR